MSQIHRKAHRRAYKHALSPVAGDAWYQGTKPIFVILEPCAWPANHSRTGEQQMLVARPNDLPPLQTYVYKFEIGTTQVVPLSKLMELVASGARVVPGTPDTELVCLWRNKIDPGNKRARFNTWTSPNNLPFT